jgi:small-conductance mechanosensitive channel
MKIKHAMPLMAMVVLMIVVTMPPSQVVAQDQGPRPAPASTRVSRQLFPATAESEEVITGRTPVPTATPGALDDVVQEISAAAGLEEASFLGLSADNWISLGVSLLLVLLGYLLGTWLIGRVLIQIVRRTPTELDDAPVEAISPSLRWLVVILVLNFATTRLSFVSAGLKAVLQDVYFVVALYVIVRMLLKLIDFTDDWYRERLEVVGREDEFEPLIALSVRVGRVLAVIIGITILLSHFGVNVSAIAAALGVGGLAFSLAARDTIADAISGFIILLDRPFRIGDRIEIQGANTWGDVMNIGIRTTSIRTRDNRMVIVPNSVIGKNQVINYTYPDPQYRIETHLGIAYGTDIETARRAIIEAVGQVEGVLPDKPVDALYIEMGESAMIFRVRWWIESYVDTRRMFDRVNTALQQALDEAAIDMPFPTQTLQVQIEPNSRDTLDLAPDSEGEIARQAE